MVKLLVLDTVIAKNYGDSESIVYTSIKNNEINYPYGISIIEIHSLIGYKKLRQIKRIVKKLVDQNLLTEIKGIRKISKMDKSKFYKTV